MAALAEEEASARGLVDRAGSIERPEPPIGTELEWEAWHRLRHDRQYIPTRLSVREVTYEVVSESAIPFTALDTYATRFGIAGEAFETFHRLVTSLDDEWLLIVAERLPQ